MESDLALRATRTPYWYLRGQTMRFWFISLKM
jgi:hypothetical protein